MERLIAVVISGILLGGIYSLIALGIVVVYKSSKIVSFTQGAFVIAGAIMGWALVGVAGLPVWLGLLLSLAGCGLIGLAVDRFALRPIIGQPIMASILITIALSWLFDSMAILSISGRQRAFPVQIAADNIEWGLVLLPKAQLLCFIIAVILSALFVLFYRYHKVGLAMRGTSEDHEVIQNLGIKVTSIFSYSWLIAALSGGIGGILLASMINVSPGLSGVGLIALVVVLVGGMDSIPGALVMGPAIGILENLSIYLDLYVGGGSREVIPYVILVVVLLIKPYGLFGLERIERI
ncbi:MAG: hypothetical protein B1H11_00690 [Desulfobacteraceae bacterium 4484_190.1]|nr:MAG: hypothetical protein B1H11_00690 [Desulfobacteraceae bacterium 4484_190.1]HDH87723.1 branched-chain amino acid ABC transporter permease [Desulfobacteraceae bacterium]